MGFKDAQMRHNAALRRTIIVSNIKLCRVGKTFSSVLGDKFSTSISWRGLGAIFARAGRPEAMFSQAVHNKTSNS